MSKDKPSDKPDRWAKRIKEAKWNVRFIPFGYALIVSGGAYCFFFPARPIPWHDELLASVLFGGMLLWLQSIYFDEKHFLKTGKERLSWGHTMGLGLCVIGLILSLLLDKKPPASQWLWVAVALVYFLNRIAKHVVVHRAARQPQR